MLEKETFPKVVVGALALILLGVIFIISLITGEQVQGKTNLSASVASSLTSTTLQKGVRNNSEVLALQQFLTDKGYYVGKVDGSFGKETEDAVKSFQTAYGIKPTGVFGGTWESLDGKQAQMPQAFTACDTDLDSNGMVGVSDLLIFFASYGQTGTNLAGDFNEDGTVDVDDLLVFMGFYGHPATCSYFHISTTDNFINDGYVIQVDETEYSDQVDLFEFNIENQGNSDISLSAIPVLFKSSSSTNNDPDDLMTSVYLYAGAELLDEQSLVTTDTNNQSETVTFDFEEFVLEEGSSEDFLVKADFKPASQELNVGDKVWVSIDNILRNSIVASDENGSSVPNVHRTGTAASFPSVVQLVGLMLEFISGEASAVDANNGLFEITFSAEAFGSDVWVDHSAPLLNGGTGEIDLDTVGGGTLQTSTVTSTAPSEDYGFVIFEGDVEEITVSATVIATGDGFVKMKLQNVPYALSDVEGNIPYTIGLIEFETPEIYLSND
jgi:peptidoglycan hydrolase-like protein with peptidoglycan-binding domain